MGLHCLDMSASVRVSLCVSVVLGRSFALLAAMLSFPLRVAAQPPRPDAPRVGLYDSVSAVLLRRWPDIAKRQFIVAPLVEEHRARADSARTFGDEVAAVQALLRKIPSSHLGLTSVTAYHTLSAALAGTSEPMFGLQLTAWHGRWYATSVLDGGPAERAGIRNWDEILEIDGVSPERSPILDYSTDDAYLDDVHDPPVHPLLSTAIDSVRLRVRITTDSVTDVTVAAMAYSAWEATQASVDVIESDGIRIGYVHLWYMFLKDVSGWLADRFDREWSTVDALVLDLRGRGGDGGLAPRIAELISGSSREQRFRGPVVALQDRQTRSAKEVLVELLRRQNLARVVGEPTAGAVVGSGSAALGNGMTLLMPAEINGPRYERLELHPQQPDVAVAWGGPLSGLQDPILRAGLQEAGRMVRAQGRGVVLPAPLTRHSKINARSP